MIEKKRYPVAYMFILTAICSSLVIGLTQSTAKRVQANETLIFEQAVLSVFPELYDSLPKRSGMDIHKVFNAKITPPDNLTGNAYSYRVDNKILGYALPLEGQGFWAPIKAVIGIAADGQTVTGFAVYQQNETPGLGAEISKPEFKKQFKGKILNSAEKFLNIQRQETSPDQSSINAITGATQTSVRLEQLINDGLKAWRDSISRENK